MNGHIEKGISNAFNKLKVTRDDRKIDDVIIKYCLYLSLRARTVFNFFRKIAGNLAAQQQTSTVTRQKISFFYAKFSAEFIEISLFF